MCVQVCAGVCMVHVYVHKSGQCIQQPPRRRAAARGGAQLVLDINVGWGLGPGICVVTMVMLVPDDAAPNRQGNKCKHPPPRPPRSGRPGVRDPAPDPKCLLTCAEQSRRQEQAGGKEEGALLVQVVESTCGKGQGGGQGQRGRHAEAYSAAIRAVGRWAGVGSCGQLCAAV